MGKVFKKENMPYLLSVVIIVLMMGWMNSCSRRKSLKQEKETIERLTEQNFRALTDSIEMVKTKMGDIEFSKASFAREFNDLKKYNSDLYEEIKSVKGDVISYIDSKLDVEVPTLEADNELVKYDDTRYGLRFMTDYNDPGFKLRIGGISNFRLLEHTIIPGTTILDSTFININIKYGFKELNNGYEVFALSPSPMIKLNHLDGHMFIDKPSLAVPDTKIKKFGIGVQTGVYYVPFMNQFQYGVGIGLSYNLFRF